MNSIVELSEKEYRNFFKKSKYNHFLQSYEWGQVAKERKQVPVYLGFKNDKNQIVAGCLALKKNVPFIKKSYFYAPRGVLIDYNNFDLLKEFTLKLKEYLKKQNAIYFKMDPGIIYQEIDNNAIPVTEGKNNYELYNYLIKLGYKHRGFNKLFENNQPRYTFRIDTSKPIEKIEKNMDRGFLQKVKKSYYYELEVTHEYDNDKFYELMGSIANKNHFSGNSKLMYKKLAKVFSESDMIEFFTIKIYPDIILAKVRQELNTLKDNLARNSVPRSELHNTNARILRLEKDIQKFLPYENKYPNGIVSLIDICPKTTNSMWMLYIGNNDLATYTFAVNRDYYEAVKYACDHKLKFLDLFGTIGDPKTKERNYAGLHEFKSNLGGTYTEFIGEFDIVINKFWYKVLPVVINVYRKLKSKLKK